MEEMRSTLRFIDYVVNKVEFYNNENFQDQPVEIDFKIRKKIEYLEDENNTFLVTLDTKVFENARENNYPFSMNISITGIFEIENEDVDNRKSFSEINSVAILFPYLRSIVSTYSANANVQPLILPPINVIKMLQQDNNS